MQASYLPSRQPSPRGEAIPPIFAAMSADGRLNAGAHTAPRRVWLLVCFATIYVVWGSTYLAIKFTLAGFPPMVLGAFRYPLAGLLLLGLARLQGPLQPITWPHVRTAVWMGFLMMVLGNSLVVWAEETVPSGWAALTATLEPLWVVALQWRQYRHNRKTLWALACGICGMLVLIYPTLHGVSEVPLPGMLLCVLAALSWGYGTVAGPRLPQSSNTMQNTALQLIAGGILAALAAGPLGFWARFDVQAIPPRAWVGMAYLTVMGSAVAYTAFTFLLRHVPPAQVVTHTYVNPVVAVLLGVWLLHEPVNLRVGLAAMLLIGAVWLMTRVKQKTANS